MGRAMDSVQAERAGRSHIAPVSLVKLTTYTDRVSGTTGEIFYLSNLACEYDYGNTGTNQVFLPAVIGGSPFFSGLSSHDPSDLTAYAQSFDLQLDNTAPFNGSRMAELLQANNLEGASIEIAQLLVDSIDSLPLDLTGYDGDEHTVLFRGRVNRVAPITNELVTIQCATELPNLAGSWVYASDDTKVDPQDLGKRYPRIYGKAKRVPCVAYEVGWSGTLVDELDASETGSGYEISDGSGLPAGTFTIRVDSEEITCSTAAATTLTIVTRGVNSTTAAVHKPGALFLEMITTPKWIISDRQSDAVNEIYALNPLNGMLLRLDSSVLTYTTTLNESILGGTMTTLSFTSAQMSALLEYFQAQHAASVSITETASTYSQKPHSITGNITDSEDEGGGLDGVYTHSEDPSVAVVSGNHMTAHFADPGNEALDYQESEVWVTKPSGTVEDVEIYAGGVLAGTINGAGMPAYGGTPAKYSFTGGTVGDIKIDPKNSGGVIVFNINRQIQVPYTFSGTMAGTSAATNISGEDADELRDGNTGTGFGGTGIGEYWEVTFADPGFAYDEQTIKIHMDAFTGGRDYYIKVYDGDSWVNTEPGLMGHSQNIVGSNWFSYTTENQGNSVRMVSNSTLLEGPINEIQRTCTQFGSPTASLEVALFGFGLRFFADVDGIEAPDGTYEASSGVVMSHPCDIIKHWIEEIGGETLNSASESAYATALGASAEWGFDARSLGFSWEEVLQRMAFEGRANIVAVEKSTGREWLILSAENDYGYNDDSIATITQTHDMTDVGRSVDDIASYFSFRYAFDASLPGGGNEEGFKLALDATPSVSDVPITTALITSASQRFGAVESSPIAFRCIQDPDTAKDVAGFIVQERMANDRRVYELRGVAWYDALPYDVGDIVSITAPWSSSATTCRITSMSKAFKSNAWTLTAAEVLTDGNGLRTP
jgi:hypothetical protein